MLILLQSADVWPLSSKVETIRKYLTHQAPGITSNFEEDQNGEKNHPHRKYQKEKHFAKRQTPYSIPIQGLRCNHTAVYDRE